MPLNLFPPDKLVGVFRGFREGGLEFHADLALPYRNEFQSVPMHGQFLLVQLESPNEAVLGRISSLSSEGKLSSTEGEEFNIRAVKQGRAVPEDLREQYLRYRVNIRVLGVVRLNGASELTFVPSHRRLPHVGSPVAFLSDAVLQEIAGHTADGAALGYLALGEYVYASGVKGYETEPWMQLKTPEISIKFSISNLVSRRSFVFARAGFGKSNLVKLLFSQLYSDTPRVEKRGNTQVPVGTVIFDPDGEYFWPDDKGRPGLCDVPHLQDRLVVFTPRVGPSAYYQSFVAGGIKLDIRRLRPGDVIAITLDPERQEQQNVRKLRGLPQHKWSELVDLIDQHGHQTPEVDIKNILGLEGTQQVEALAARANMVAIVRSLHSKSSQLMDMLIHALSEGKLCVIDVSQMRGSQALMLSGLILRRIFDRNQEEFTSATPRTIPTIAVVEEAQSVLNERATSAEPYITWVKEGRKYDLGAVLITQQPGSIPNEILSQGDNWFVFHLLSAGDLSKLKNANSHFSDDLLSSLLNEPIPGQGIFWSSAGGKPYPLPVRALLFEAIYTATDSAYCAGAVETYASLLRDRFTNDLREALVSLPTVAAETAQSDEPGLRLASLPGFEDHTEEVDVLALHKKRAIDALKSNQDVARYLQGKGMAWGGLKRQLAEVLPDTLENKDQIAYELVREALDEIYGLQGRAWHTFRSESTNAVWVRLGPEPSN